jgi:CheY-like chemotaxis protein
MDGLTATAAIRNREADTGRPRTPIVALTANAMAHQVEQYIAAGMDGHVAKPIQAAELFDTLTRAAAPDEAKPGGGAHADVA